MVRSRHGRKGVKHGETGARRRQGTILAASPGTLVFKRTFGAVGPSKKRGSPALSVMLDCSSPVWLVDVLGNEARQIGQAARLIRSAGEPEFPIGITDRLLATCAPPASCGRSTKVRPSMIAWRRSEGKESSSRSPARISPPPPSTPGIAPRLTYRSGTCRPGDTSAGGPCPARSGRAAAAPVRAGRCPPGRPA